MISIPEYERIRTRKGVRTTRKLEKRDEEVKVPHARLKVSRLTKARASVLTDARTSVLKETLASVRLKN